MSDARKIQGSTMHFKNDRNKKGEIGRSRRKNQRTRTAEK